MTVALVPLLSAPMTFRSTSLLRTSYLYVSISTTLGGTLLFWVGSYRSICGRLFSCVEMGHFGPWRGVGMSAATSHLTLRFCGTRDACIPSIGMVEVGLVQGGVRAPSSVNLYGFVGQLGPSRVSQRYLRPMWINMCDVR